jgi:hypothetical protein
LLPETSRLPSPLSQYEEKYDDKHYPSPAPYHKPVAQPVYQPVYQPVNQPVYQPVYHPQPQQPVYYPQHEDKKPECKCEKVELYGVPETDPAPLCPGEYYTVPEVTAKDNCGNYVEVVADIKYDDKYAACEGATYTWSAACPYCCDEHPHRALTGEGVDACDYYLYATGVSKNAPGPYSHKDACVTIGRTVTVTCSDKCNKYDRRSLRGSALAKHL